MTQLDGPATSLIDFGYAVKLSLSERVDQSLGLNEEDHCSLVHFLNVCYVLRRPGFEFWDAVLATYFPSAPLE